MVVGVVVQCLLAGREILIWRGLILNAELVLTYLQEFSAHSTINLTRMESVIKNIAKANKILAYILCVTLFLASLWVLFEKHVEELTGISVELIPVKTLTMPSLTVCSEEPFKSNGDYSLEEDFVQNSFTMSDIFGPDFRGDNVSIKVTEARSYMFGLCYTVTSLHPVGAHEISKIPLTKSKNLKIFVHDSGDEFWIIHSFFPVPVDVVAIEGK